MDDGMQYDPIQG